MNKGLEELSEEVIDEKTFIIFIKALIEDREKAVKLEKKTPASPYSPDAGGWENTSIESYLEAATAWAEDSNFGRKIAFPEYELKDVSPWKLFAAFLVAGIGYE